MRRLPLLAVFALILATLTVPAEAVGPCTDDTDQCRQERIVALEAKVAELEARLVALEPTPSSSPTPTPTATPSPTPTPTPSPTPTPTPSPSPACSGTPGAEGGTDPWGTCWPGPANTGVPAGTALTVVTGNQTYSTANQVISGKDIRGCVTVTAPGVVIKNSKITCGGFYVVDYYPSATPSVRLTLQDVTISCGNKPGHGVGEKHVNVLRANISGCENGFDLDSDGDVRDSYIHDLYSSSTAHTDGLQSAVGHRIILDHNVWYAVDTSAVNINNNASGPVSVNTTVSRNLMAGGAYTLYCPKPPTTNFKVIDNRFSRKFWPKVGYYGPWTDCGGEITSGNVYADTGQPI